MIRRIILTSVSVVALTAAASAADLWGPAGPGGYKDGPAYPMWTGFYVGGHLGAAGEDDKIADLDKLNGGARYTLSASGFIGGGQAGYNWQGALGSSLLVLGVRG